MNEHKVQLSVPDPEPPCTDEDSGNEWANDFRKQQLTVLRVSCDVLMRRMLAILIQSASLQASLLKLMFDAFM